MPGKKSQNRDSGLFGIIWDKSRKFVKHQTKFRALEWPIIYV